MKSIKEQVNKQILQDKMKYGVKTVGDLILVLNKLIENKELTPETKINLSDFEFNGRQRNFEISWVEGEKELFFMYEKHEDEWV